MTKWRPSPEDVARIVEHAQQHMACEDCAAAPGEPCTRPGSGRSIHKSRYVSAAIEARRQAKAAQRTPEKQAELDAALAQLPRVPREEIEACKTAKGGYAFTKAWFLERGLSYPPLAGWRQAVEREQA